MKLIKYIPMLCIALVLASCFNNSELTSPDNQKISLKKENDSVNVSIKSNQKAIINNELELTFGGVNADSRCPSDVVCVWEGDGEIKLALSNSSGKKDVTLHTTIEPKSVDFFGYRINLKSLSPYPKSTEQIKQEDYVAELTIKYLSNPESNGVVLIDENDDSILKRDMINVNSVKLEKDILTFEVEYSGGCKEHEIKLYAYKSIQKSNPAQVTVVLSHDANEDYCKALINREIKFDLSTLKNYLKENYNIQDKAILLLFDPSGRPLRDPVVEYNF